MSQSRSVKIVCYIMLLLPFVLMVEFVEAGPWLRLLLAVVVNLAFVRAAAFLWQWNQGARPSSLLGFLAYTLAWPGISFKGFEARQSESPPETGRNFLESWLFLLGGVAVFVTASIFGEGRSTLWNYVALFSVLSIVHLGFLEVLADGFRLMGFQPTSLFRRPLLARSLKDFWSDRWNMAFVDMNKLFVVQPLKGKVRGALLVFLVFATSGVIHEIAITYPSGGPLGLPTLYFAIQGLGFLLERKWPRPLVLAWIVLPAPILFPPQFVNLFLGGATASLKMLFDQFGLSEFISYGFIAGALMHALVLCASVQVPSRLNWREEFTRLSSLSRKAFWTYGAYIFSIIIFMGLVSTHLAGLDQFTSSDLIWAAFIALFWWGRVLADTFYMKHEDWPRGPLFDVGHICLFTLFLIMAGLYTGLAIAVAGRV